MNREDLQHLAQIRIEEAVALMGLDPPKSDGAYYLAGYAIELALKACIAKNFPAHHWPEKQFVNACHTHDIERLLFYADLKPTRDKEFAVNQAFYQNWSIVKDWNEESRYKTHAHHEAKKLIDAITDSVNGVFPWIKFHW